MPDRLTDAHREAMRERRDALFPPPRNPNHVDTIDVARWDAFEHGWNECLATLSREDEGPDDENPIDWQAEYQRVVSDEPERQHRLRERLAAMLGVEAHPVGPDNLSGTLFDRVEEIVRAHVAASVDPSRKASEDG